MPALLRTLIHRDSWTVPTKLACFSCRALLLLIGKINRSDVRRHCLKINKITSFICFVLTFSIWHVAKQRTPRKGDASDSRSQLKLSCHCHYSHIWYSRVEIRTFNLGAVSSTFCITIIFSNGAGSCHSHLLPPTATWTSSPAAFWIRLPSAWLRVCLSAVDELFSPPWKFLMPRRSYSNSTSFMHILQLWNTWLLLVASLELLPKDYWAYSRGFSTAATFFLKWTTSRTVSVSAECAETTLKRSEKPFLDNMVECGMVVEGHMKIF